LLFQCEVTVDPTSLQRRLAEIYFVGAEQMFRC